MLNVTVQAAVTLYILRFMKFSGGCDYSGFLVTVVHFFSLVVAGTFVLVRVIDGIAGSGRRHNGGSSHRRGG